MRLMVSVTLFMKLEIESTAGGKLCVLSPWPTISFDGELPMLAASGIVTLDNQPNQDMVFARE